MSFKIVVERRRAERFVMVPNDVVAMLGTGELTSAAFSVLVVAMSAPDGWSWSAPGLASASGLGRDAWRAARRVLVACGAMSAVRRPRVAGGRVSGSVFSIDWPPHRETGNPAVGGSHRETGLPAVGEPVPVGTGNPAPFLRHTPARRAAAQAAVRRVAPGKVPPASRGAELVELGEAAGVQEVPPSVSPRTPCRLPAAPVRPVVPEVREFLASRGAVFVSRRENSSNEYGTVEPPSFLPDLAV